MAEWSYVIFFRSFSFELFSFFFMSTFDVSLFFSGVCCPFLGEQFLGQCFTPEKKRAVSVIGFRRVFASLVTLNRKTDAEETAVASSSALGWLSSGFVSAAALQSSHSLWVWNSLEWFFQQCSLVFMHYPNSNVFFTIWNGSFSL